MREGPQFSLRSLFIATAVIAMLLGGYLGFSRLSAEAHRKAVRSAFKNGRLTRESALEYLGPHDEVFREITD